MEIMDFIDQQQQQPPPLIHHGVLNGISRLENPRHRQTRDTSWMSMNTASHQSAGGQQQTTATITRLVE
jgi:hypothetical protein